MRGAYQRSFLALCLLLSFVGTVAASPALASTQALGTIKLVAQTAYVPADGEFTLSFTWDGPLTLGTKVEARVYQPLTSIADLNSGAVDILTAPVSYSLISLPQSSGRVFTLTIPVRSFPANDSPALYLPADGVHPVSIEISDSDEILGQLNTNLIHLPDEATSIDPVSVSIILPVTQADGLASGLTIADTTVILQQHPNLPMTIQIGADGLSQLAIDEQLNSEFSEALGDRLLVVSPGLDLDPSALAEIGQGRLFTQSVDTARTQAVELGLLPATNILPWDGTLTAAGVDLIAGIGIEVLLASSGSTVRTGILNGNNTSVEAVQPSGEFSSQLDTGDDVVARAHQLLAELALLTRSDTSPVILGGDAFQQLDRRSLEILLDSWEVLAPVQLVSLQQAVAAQSSPPIRVAEQPEQDLAPLGEIITQIEAMIATYQSYFLNGGTEPEWFQTALISSLSRERNPTDRQLRINQIVEDIETSFAPINVVENQQFTLTTTRFALPLQLETAAVGPRQVLIRFQSDKIKVYTDSTYSSDQDLIVTLSPGATTMTINVEAKALGLSPVDVIILTPDGQRQLATGQFSVRSTGIPGLGLLLSGTAGVFLFVWWLTHHRRERKGEANPIAEADNVTA